MLKNAALCQTADKQYHLYFNAKTHAINAPAYLEQWLPILAEHDIDILWVMPDTELSRHISWDDFDRIDRDRNKVFPDRPDNDHKPSFVSVRKRSSQFERDHYFAFPQHGEWHAGEKGQWFIPSPHILGQTISYLRKEFECDVMWGPGNIGMKILKRSFDRKGWQFENTDLDDHLREIINGSMFRPIWKRFEGLTDTQKRMRYVHGYDKNAQYLGAAQGAFLGRGKPEKVMGAMFGGSVGFWKYQITDVSNTAFDGYELPCPLDVNRQWASSDLLMAARYCGVEFDILEGYVWEQNGKFLENWSKEMWQHRADLRDKTDIYTAEIARENAEGTAKLAANMMMGRLAKPGSRELYKPDWNQLIVHRAISNQMYSFNKWQRLGVKPILVSTDSFWILSDEQDPARAMPGLLDYMSEQRGYKHIGTLPMNEEIAYMFDAHSAEAVNGFLKREVEGHAESV